MGIPESIAAVSAVAVAAHLPDVRTVGGRRRVRLHGRLWQRAIQTEVLSELPEQQHLPVVYWAAGQLVCSVSVQTDLPLGDSRLAGPSLPRQPVVVVAVAGVLEAAVVRSLGLVPQMGC